LTQAWHSWEIYDNDFLLGLSSVVNLNLSSSQPQVSNSVLHREIFGLESEKLRQACQEIETYSLTELESAATRCGVDWV
jgi:hypothetical protein